VGEQVVGLEKRAEGIDECRVGQVGHESIKAVATEGVESGRPGAGAYHLGGRSEDLRPMRPAGWAEQEDAWMVGHA